MTAHGLPAEKAARLNNLAANDGPTDGVSQTATAPPTSVLVTLATAGRNPTDIVVPTQAGTEGSGGEEEDDAVSGAGNAAGGMTFSALGDGGGSGGSHEAASQGIGGMLWGAITYTAKKLDQATGVVAVYTLTGKVVSMDSASGTEILGAAAKGADDGAAVVVDTFTFGNVCHEQSQRAQEEAIARGDVVSQIGFGAGKVGARFAQAAVVVAAAPVVAGALAPVATAVLPAALTSASVACTAATTASAVSVPFMVASSYYRQRNLTINSPTATTSMQLMPLAARPWTGFSQLAP